MFSELPKKVHVKNRVGRRAIPVERLGTGNRH